MNVLFYFAQVLDQSFNWRKLYCSKQRHKNNTIFPLIYLAILSYAEAIK